MATRSDNPLDDSDFDSDEYDETDDGTDEDSISSVLRRLTAGPVPIRVESVIIKGNYKINGSLIESVLDRNSLLSASTFQELVYSAGLANARLERLGVFDSVRITLDAGPDELPGSAIVVVELTEARNSLAGDLNVYGKPETKAFSLEGSLKLKNLFGYADIWDISSSYMWDQPTEISTGLTLPRFKSIPTPLSARVSLLSQDWLNLSSYKETLMGLSLGLISTMNHDLAFNITLNGLTNPSHMASDSIMRNLGESILSFVKYQYKIDERDSHIRPTHGYFFLSSTQIGGLVPHNKSLRFFKQEFDFRAALPLGFLNSSLNFGLATGFIIPWGRQITELPLQIPQNYDSIQFSSIGRFGGPHSLLGFKSKFGLERENELHERGESIGDLAVTAFTDLSFDLPIKFLREKGVFFHAFVNGGNLARLNKSEIKNFSVRRCLDKFKSSAGFGVVVPTKLFRLEINYCYILKQFENANGKTGIQCNFSSP